MQSRKVIFTGQSGIKCRDSIRNFIKFATPFSRGKRRKPLFVNIEDGIKQAYLHRYKRKDRPSVWMTEILKLPIPELRDLWVEAFGQAKKRIKDASVQDRDIFVNFHACFHHPETVEYFSIARYSFVREFKPDMFITLVDDIYDIHIRLRRKYQIFHPSNAPTKDPLDVIFQLIRILVWRANEIMMTGHFASDLGKPHYIFAVKHDADTLFKLIFGEEMRFYISHPITEIRRLIKGGETEKVSAFQDEIHRFESAMGNEIIAFIPTTVDELRIDKEKVNGVLTYKPRLSSRWDFEKYENPVNLLFVPPKPDQRHPLWDVEQNCDFQLARMLELLHNFIDVQVSSRDHKLVEQSNCLAVYRPCFNGNPSGGVETEINYYERLRERNRDKRCFIYLPLKDQHKLKVRQFMKILQESFAVSENHDAIKDFERSDYSRKLVEADDSPEMIVDIIDDMVEKYSLELRPQRRGLYTEDYVEAGKLKAELVEKYISAYRTYLDIYKSAATHIWEEDDLTPELFVSNIVKVLANTN